MDRWTISSSPSHSLSTRRISIALPGMVFVTGSGLVVAKLDTYSREQYSTVVFMRLISQSLLIPHTVHCKNSRESEVSTVKGLFGCDLDFSRFFRGDHQPPEDALDSTAACYSDPLLSIVEMDGSPDGHPRSRNDERGTYNRMRSSLLFRFNCAHCSLLTYV
ncbi:hypothetical protein B0T19DRAFT_432271, partial [Cercophora scortea]